MARRAPSVWRSATATGSAAGRPAPAQSSCASRSCARARTSPDAEELQHAIAHCHGAHASYRLLACAIDQSAAFRCETVHRSPCRPKTAPPKKLDDASSERNRKLADEKLARTEAQWKKSLGSICTGCL